MLSKEQANNLAQDLLDHEEAARIERLNAAVVHLSWIWTCPEFKLLAPHQRGDIVQQAKASMRLDSFLLFYCFIGFSVFFGWWLERSPVHQADVACLPALVFFLYWLVWAFGVRREVRKLAAEMLPTWSMSDALTPM
jgi:Flp pilus assembly protein TadB